MSDSPDVSVVIPTRDRWRFLRVALRTALEQRGVAVEVVVVDDGSADETAARLADLRDPRVRVLRHDVSLGLPRARNAGIAAASGEWLAFLDDDDLWSPDKLRSQLAAARERDAAWAYASAIELDEELRVGDLVPAPDPGRLRPLLLSRNAIPAGSSNVVARTAVVRSAGGFDEALPQLADWDLWIRLCDVGPPARRSEVLVGYVLHRGSMLGRDPRGVLSEIAYLRAKHAPAGEAAGEPFDPVLIWRWIAWTHRRAGQRRAAARAYLRAAVDHRGPGDLLRAAGALLGERAIGLRSAGRDRWHGPEWLAGYADMPGATSAAQGSVDQQLPR